ncbi:hypothetical protein ASF61_20230 [Duganella sp. Leaf126]|uniref:DUF5610 domain-containing protein n=1 Tax=Duganella sp. Leaf126 TaxID=1736266 RepID=UPI00070070B4|nr:DUF5610 domain-containing protein [Duganella sp. Leaf126]KQQ45292.1 hypothetical protein ASF61_20230 [Duganella sp. Leaf126]
MATPVSITPGSSNVGSSSVGAVKASATGSDKTADVSPTAKAKAQLNASIVQASLTVSLKTANDPMSVVFKTALTGINEALEADFGKDAIQNAASQDNTPEATANRIVALSTGFYEAYKRQNPGQDDETALNNFMDTVKKGVEQGFKEARSILEGFKVLNGELSANIDKTYDLIQKGFADFAAAQKAPPAGAEATGAVGVSAAVTPKAPGNGDSGAGVRQIDPPAV